MSPAPALRQGVQAWRAPARRSPSLVAPTEFLFLNMRGSLAEIGWDGAERDRLWRYHQHYFDDLNAAEAHTRREWHFDLLDDWIRRNPPRIGVGWEPYPTSLRISNLVKWALGGNELTDNIVGSLAIQCRWLMKRLEFHLLGNHLLANAKALVFAGLFFDGDEADRWLAKGLAILAREVPEQVLEDGGHFERSTMYHALVLEDLLDLCNLARCYTDAPGKLPLRQVEDWRIRAKSMCAWLHAMCHPDGEISFFNDAALGIAPPVSELDAYAERLGLGTPAKRVGTAWLKESGYARLERRHAVAVLDMAPVGPDYIAGHAHADTLSFELSLFSQRVLVNSGTSCYGNSAERLRQRGTAAHNTVVVNGRDSSEVWGGFRVARRARPVGPQVRENSEIQASCRHDGYHELPGRPLHERQWTLGDGWISVFDAVSGMPHSAEARFHFHPAVWVTCVGDERFGRGVLPNGESFCWRVEQGTARIECSTWHPRFGETHASRCLVVTLQHGQSLLRISWA